MCMSPIYSLYILCWMAQVRAPLEDAQEPLCQRRQQNMQAPSFWFRLGSIHGAQSNPALWWLSNAWIRLVLWNSGKLTTCKWLIFCWTRQKSLLLTATILTAVTCLTSIARIFIQRIGTKQIIWEHKGRLISPLHPTIHDMVQFKLVTSPCNLLIFPCQRHSQPCIYRGRISLAALQ